MPAISAEMGQLAARRPRHLARLRDILRRPEGEESHNVLDEHDLVGSALGARDRRVPAIGLRAQLPHHVPAASQNHSVMWRLAENQEQYRAVHR